MSSLAVGGTLLRRLSVPSLTIAFCVLYIRQTQDLPARSVTFPWLVIGAILVVVVLIVATDIRSLVAERRTAAGPQEAVAPEPGEAVSEKPLSMLARRSRPFIAPVSLLAFIVLLPRIGIHLSSALFMAITLPLLGYRSPIRIAVCVIAVLIVVEFVFLQTFRLPLPGRW